MPPDLGGVKLLLHMPLFAWSDGAGPAYGLQLPSESLGFVMTTTTITTTTSTQQEPSSLQKVLKRVLISEEDEAFGSSSTFCVAVVAVGCDCWLRLLVAAVFCWWWYYIDVFCWWLRPVTNCREVC